MPSPAPLRGVEFAADSEHTLGTVQWLMKKALLRQDAILLGSHPAALRRLVFRYAQLLEREVEVISITRDSTESDLKQRRELRGGSVEYVDQPPRGRAEQVGMSYISPVSPVVKGELGRAMTIERGEKMLRHHLVIQVTTVHITHIYYTTHSTLHIYSVHDTIYIHAPLGDDPVTY